jgi:excisionase family DNA binding protein
MPSRAHTSAALPLRSLVHPDAVDLSHRLLTPTDVADLLSIPLSTVYELARDGRLPTIRIGRAVRFDRRDLETHLALHCRRGGAPWDR